MFRSRGAAKDRDVRLGGRLVRLFVPVERQVHLDRDVALLHVRKNERQAVVFRGRERVRRRKLSHRALVLKHSQTDLLQIIRALGIPRGIPGHLDRRKQEPDQHPNDGDHDQQLNERERMMVTHDGIS